MHLHLPVKHRYGAATDEFLAFVVAYSDLLAARWEAQDRRPHTRARPVPLPRLRDKGVPDHLLLWMLYQAHVEHLRLSADGCNGGALGAAGSLLFTPSSSFSLTDRGQAFASEFLAAALPPDREGAGEAARDALVVGRLTPRYDKENRVFCWGRHVLKCFRQPSVNQELILSAAEELGWGAWFDDPLPKRSGKNSKVRLHDTIKDLNRYQTPHFIHFKGDGTGTRIGWQYR